MHPRHAETDSAALKSCAKIAAMGRVSDRLLVVLIAAAAALAYLFHEILKDAVDQWLTVRLAEFGGLLADVSERTISLSLTTALAVLLVWALYLRIRHE